MTTRTITSSGSVAGKAIGGNVRRTGATETNGEITLAAGSAGTLTTRTDNDTGTVTLTTGHGQTSGTFDVFWGGATPGCRRGMTGTVTVNALALDVGTGDSLPLAATAVVVDKQEIVDFDSTAATIVLAGVGQTRRASVQFQQADGTPVKSLDLGRDGTDGEPYVWASNTDVSTPFGADLGKIAVSNGSSAGTNTIVIGVLRS